MTNKKEFFTVNVFNTTTNTYESVGVSKEVYHTLAKTEWKIKNNDKSFFKHEIQFSSLIGGEEGTYENFKEFIGDENYIIDLILQQERHNTLHNALDRLSKGRRRRIILHHIYGFSLEKIAVLEGVRKSTVKWSIEEGMRQLKEFLRNF